MAPAVVVAGISGSCSLPGGRVAWPAGPSGVGQPIFHPAGESRAPTACQRDLGGHSSCGMRPIRHTAPSHSEVRQLCFPICVCLFGLLSFCCSHCFPFTAPYLLLCLAHIVKNGLWFFMIECRKNLTHQKLEARFFFLWVLVHTSNLTEVSGMSSVKNWEPCLQIFLSLERLPMIPLRKVWRERSCG